MLALDLSDRLDEPETAPELAPEPAPGLPDAAAVASLHVLDRILDEIAYLGGRSERYFLRAGTSLGKAVGRFDRFAAPLAKLAEISGSGKLAALVGYATELEDQSRDLMQTLHRVFEAVDVMHRGALDLEGEVVEMRRIIQTMSIVALNARVNAAVLTTRNAELDAFTLAASGLVDEAYAITGAIDGTIRQMLLRVAAADAESIALSRAFDTGLFRTLSEIRGHVGRLDAEVAQATAAGGQTAGRIRAIQQAVSSVVTTLQIGDATHQRLQNAARVIATAAQILRANGTLSRPVVQLASALLRDAKDRHDTAIGIGRADLQRATDLTQDLIGSDRVGGATGADCSGSIQQGVTTLRQILERCRASQTQLDPVATQLQAGFATMIGIMGTMDDVEIRTRLISLNAVIVCSRLGGEGKALRENALQLRDLVGRSSAQFGRLRARISALSPVVASVGQRLLVDVGSKLRAIAALEASLITELDEITAIMLEAQGAATRAKAVRGHEIGDGERALAAQSDLFGTVTALIERLDLLDRGTIPVAPDTDCAPEFVDLRSIYTMETERVVHDRLADAFGLAERCDEGAQQDGMVRPKDDDLVGLVLF
ncbi:methyl-accepting chemotaxis protein [Paracoccaceae bacterium Fryx2]|nr:methyl-accepting chemotaxis protein [Paracoccaceae bacterium Fryx2]